MNLRDFLEDWEGQGVSTIEVERRKQEGGTWILYKVTEIASTTEYGRHYALMIVANQAEEVIAHNFHNTSQHSQRPFMEQAAGWWEEHLAEGLVDPEGNRICV